MYSRIIATLSLTLICISPLRASDAYDRAKEAVEVSDYVEAVTQIRLALKEDPRDEGTLLLATKIYCELEQADSALLYGTRLYEFDDDKPEYAWAYAQALVLAKQAPKAVAMLKRIQKQSPSVETSLQLVSALLEADSVKAAELVATSAKKEYPQSADAYFALGTLYAKYKPQPVLELAKNNLEKSIELDSTRVPAHFSLAEIYWKMANREPDKDLANELFRRSLIEWNKVGQLDPRNARAWFEQGKIFYLAKKYRESISALQRYSELRPGETGNPIATWYLGKSFFELQVCDSAKVYLTAAVERIDSLKSEAAVMLGKCNVLTRQWKDAATWYGSAYQANRGAETWDPNDLWFYGTALVMAGDTTNAVSVMTDAAKRDPGNCQFMFRFGYLLGMKGLTTQSTQIYQQRLASCSDSLNGKINMFIGNNFYQDSVVDSAIVYYERALALEHSAYVMNRLAETYGIAGNEVKARELYGQVVTAGQAASAEKGDKQAAVQAILKLNGLDLTSKKYDDIVARCKTGLTIDSTNHWLMLYMAFGYQGSGSTENACKWYKEVLKIDPKNDTAAKNLKALGC